MKRDIGIKEFLQDTEAFFNMENHTYLSNTTLQILAVIQYTVTNIGRGGTTYFSLSCALTTLTQ